MTTDAPTKEAVATVGNLLIRAAATLGALSPEQQLQLANDSDLAQLLAACLRGAARASPVVADAIRSHPPRGFNTMQ